MVLAEVRGDNSSDDDDDDDDEEGAEDGRNLPIEHISVARKTLVVDHW